VHSTELGPLRYTWKTRVVRRLCAYPFRWLPSAIVVDAAATAKLHASLGYAKGKMAIIKNGVDLSQFRRDGPARKRLREIWEVSGDVILLGLVARWHPLKDHSNLLRALSIVKTSPGSKFHCALVGEGMTAGNADLMTLIRDNGLIDEVILLGPRTDIAAVMNALDLHVLSSSAESLPFAVIEAMACETPCVLTNVGDAAVIVGGTGWVVPPMAPQALATAIEAAMAAIAANGKAALGRQCRVRAVNAFGLEAMARAYEERWLEAQH
jgi:glycosyltransferase involved in cell wall biosynthesis